MTLFLPGNRVSSYNGQISNLLAGHWLDSGNLFPAVGGAEQVYNLRKNLAAKSAISIENLLN